VVHVPTDEQGMDVYALEDILKTSVARGERPKLIYTISVYQNPLGTTLSLERRRRMLEVSQKYGVPILENESYADFRIDGPPLPPALSGMDDRGLVMYVSAYTKLLGCGLRLGYAGYAVVPGPVKQALARLRFGGQPSHLAGWAVYEFMREHGDEHIAKVAASLKDKRDAMLDALAEHFPSTCTFSRPEGGMMVWVRMPEGADTWSALEKAVAAGVKYNPGPVFRAERDRKNFFRLTYSYNTPEEIRDGIAILAGVFEREGLFAAA
jgi:2-aminoadipate transaminase